MTRARQRIVCRFVEHGALMPECAITFETADRETARLLRRMRRHGAVAEAAPGRYWLDRDRLGLLRGAVRRSALAWTGTSGVVVATALARVLGA